MDDRIHRRIGVNAGMFFAFVMSIFFYVILGSDAIYTLIFGASYCLFKFATLVAKELP
jgi:hypothetical protein